jgi:sigma-E factor negative regulatory protein RseB
MYQRRLTRWVWCSAGVAAVGLLSQAVAADPSEVLIDTANAAHARNFQGVLIYQDSERLEALRVVHRSKDGSESERLTSLNGEPREIFHVNDRIYCVLPKDRMLSLQQPPLKGFLNQLTPERIRELSAWYDFKSLGTERIAARSCVGVAVMPRDNYRYGYEIWSDAETHLPLKFSLLDPSGRVREQIMFTEIDFPADIPDDVFKAEVNTAKDQLITGGELPRPLPMAPVDRGDPSLVFGAMPPGFRVVIHNQRQLPGTAGVEHILLTDGLSTISIFNRTGQGNPHGFVGASHMGSVEAYDRVVGPFHVTVVGEAPAATLKMIGDGLQPAAHPIDTDKNRSNQPAPVKSSPSQ